MWDTDESHMTWVNATIFATSACRAPGDAFGFPAPVTACHRCYAGHVLCRNGRADRALINAAKTKRRKKKKNRLAVIDLLGRTSQTKTSGTYRTTPTSEFAIIIARIHFTPSTPISHSAVIFLPALFPDICTRRQIGRIQALPRGLRYVAFKIVGAKFG